MFKRQSPDGYADPLPGVRQKTLVFGGRTLMAEFRLAGDTDLPDHSHPYEQAGYLVTGRLVVRIGGVEHEAMPGDSWCVPMNVMHGARALADSIAVEVFSPARADYLPKDCG